MSEVRPPFKTPQAGQDHHDRWVVPMLPPASQRNTMMENWLRQTHWKDIEACRVPMLGGRPWSPYATNNGSTFLSPLKPGIAAAPGGLQQDVSPLVPLAHEAEKRPPNTTIRTQGKTDGSQEMSKAEEAESAWEIAAKGEYGREQTRRQVNYGGRSRRTVQSASRRSWRESGRSFQHKHPRDTKLEAEHKLWEGDVAAYKPPDIKTATRAAKTRALYAGTQGTLGGAASRSGVEGKIGASGEIGAGKTEQSIKTQSGTFGASGKGRVLSADAKAELKGEVKFKEFEAATSGALGASAVVVEGEIGGEVRITPKRIWNGIVVSGVNTVASWFDYGKQLEETDKHDWGIVLGLGIGGTVGLAAEAEGDIGLSRKKRQAGAQGRVKVAPLVGGSVRGKAQVVW